MKFLFNPLFSSNKVFIEIVRFLVVMQISVYSLFINYVFSPQCGYENKDIKKFFHPDLVPVAYLELLKENLIKIKLYCKRSDTIFKVLIDNTRTSSANKKLTDLNVLDFVKINGCELTVETNEVVRSTSIILLAK